MKTKETKKTPLFSWISDSGMPEVWYASCLMGLVQSRTNEIGRWLAKWRPTNAEKVQLAQLIHDILKRADENHLRHVKDGSVLNFESSGIELSENYLRLRSESQEKRYPTSYEYHKYRSSYFQKINYVEHLIKELVDHLESEQFLKEFDSLPRRKQLDLLAAILPRLAQSRQGLIYLKKWVRARSNDKYLAFCHMKRLEFVSEFRSRPSDQPASEEAIQALRAFQGQLPGLLLAGNSDIDAFSIIEEMRPILEGLFPREDYDQLNSLPALSAMLNEIVEKGGEGYKHIFGPIFENKFPGGVANPLLEFNVLCKTYLAIKDPTLLNVVEFSGSLSEYFEKLRPTSFSAATITLGTLTAMLKFMEAGEAFAEDDYDLGAGWTMSGIFSIGLAVFPVPPFTGLFVLIGVAGAVLILTDESDFHEWLRTNYYGKDWDRVWRESDKVPMPQKPIGYLWKWSKDSLNVVNLPRQISDFYSLQNPIKVLRAFYYTNWEFLFIEFEPPSKTPIRHITVRTISKNGFPRLTFNLPSEFDPDASNSTFPISFSPIWLASPPLVRNGFCQFKIKGEYIEEGELEWVEVDLEPNPVRKVEKLKANKNDIYFWEEQHKRTGESDAYRDSDQNLYVIRKRAKVTVTSAPF